MSSDREIVRLREELEQCNDELIGVKDTLARREAELGQLRKALLRHDEPVKLRERIAALEKELAWREEQIRQMQATKFWQFGILYWKIHAGITSRFHFSPRPALPSEHSAEVTRPPSTSTVPEKQQDEPSGTADHKRAGHLLLDPVIAEFENRFEREPEILDWYTGLNLAACFPGRIVFSPPCDDRTLPYLDHSIDLVVIASSEPEIAREAQRAARGAVVRSTLSDREEQPSASTNETIRLANVDWQSSAVEPARPSVSIIIPCHNGAAHTEKCLGALAETLPSHFRGEILVVDDASTDETPELLTRWMTRNPQLKCLRNETNVGFLSSCNRAAQAAEGEMLVFLNNDTQPLTGWLGALLRTFREHPDAGAVGGKLILRDGSLQEAGSIVFCDGSAANFGRGDRELDAPLYNYVRAVDYCSGACLATPRQLFLELGGFDARYAPAYYEDTDYCFQIRARGFRVYYQPECAVIHFEGATAGTDLSTGVKRYQVINQAKFAEKWNQVLKTHPPRPRQLDLAAWYDLVCGCAEGEITDAP